MLKNRDVIEAKTDLLKFVEIMFKHHYKRQFFLNYHHSLICEALEQVLVGQIKRVIINIPPRYSKTELAVVNFIAWSLGIFPDSEYILVAYSKKLSSSNSWRTRNLVSSLVYRKIFPNVKLLQDSKARDEWRTSRGGIVYAAGSEGTITGYGAGKFRDEFGGAIIIDDPHKAEEANSNVRRKNVINWFSSTIESRTNSPNTPIILIMQRLHEEDLSGYLLNGGNGEYWHHISLPVKKKDQVLWEDKHDLKAVRRLEKSNSYVFAGQYMQNPAPLCGGIFKKNWWVFYKFIPQCEYKIITADTAQKTKEYNDYSVFQCWGYYCNKIYLLDQFRGKWEAPELRMRFRLFWQKHQNDGMNTALRAAYVEDKVSGTGLIQDLKKELPIKPISRYTDKVTRAMDAAPYIEGGFVLLPEKNEWVQEYLDEFGVFTPLNTHKYDDQVDCTIDAIDLMLRFKMCRSGTW